MSLYTNAKREFTIEPGCPWYQAQQSYGAPNVNWCESTKCSFINEPANTWSNLGFLIVGIILIRRMSQANIKNFGWVVIVMGLLSSIYHATNNYLTQYFDFIGMALMTSYLISLAAGRLTGNKLFSFASFFWFVFSLNLGVLMCFDIMDIPIQAMLPLNVVPIIVLELCSGIRKKNLRRYGYFAASIAVLVLAQVFAQIDLKRIYCHSDHPWLHGHVIWHLLCACGMYLAGAHFSRMQMQKK